MPAIDQVLSPETMVRLAAFVGVLAVMAGWERLTPRRALTAPRGARWRTNLLLVGVDAAVLRLMAPLAPVAAALWAQGNGIGMFAAAAAPGWLAGILTVLVLDLVIYGQHVAFHKVPVLWRLHRVHHSDLDVDTTTGVRFHPVEIGLSLLLKSAVAIALGAPAWAVVAFEVLLNGTALFNHGNVMLARPIDRVVRLVLVTPDMHRVHHSIHRRETDSNFGFNLSWWDRLFGTYRAQPADGHLGMTIGVPEFRDAARLHLGGLLAQPLSPLGRPAVSDTTEDRPGDRAGKPTR